MLREELTHLYMHEHGVDRETAPERAALDLSLVFRSSVGTPIDPKNFVRTFHELRDKAGLPRITVHHTRHTAATILKNLGVPARDAQLILGHSHITTTQQLYQHADREGQVQALTQIEQQLLTAGVAVKTAVKRKFSTGESTKNRVLTPGGPGYTFLKPSEVDELIADLVLLHGRLLELGMEYHNGEVYLADLEARNV